MQKQRKGFTLFELLIVIFIVLLLYMLVFSYLENAEKKPEPLTPLTLKSTLQESGLLVGHTTLLCVDKCKKCYLKHGLDGDFKAYEEKLDFKELEVYTIDREDELQEMEYGRFDDLKICLSIDFYPNGSSTKMILKNPDGSAYYLPSYFGTPQRFDAIEDAKTYWLEEALLVSKEGDFY